MFSNCFFPAILDYKYHRCLWYDQANARTNLENKCMQVSNLYAAHVVQRGVTSPSAMTAVNTGGRVLVDCRRNVVAFGVRKLNSLSSR